MTPNRQTELAARLEKHAADQEHAENICRRVECEEAEMYANFAADLRAAAQAVRASQWRPISEAHEDYGQCVFININDPGCPYCASTLETDYAENLEWYGWTHFMPIVLTNEDAEILIVALPAPPEVVG